jgi:nitroreductase
MLELHPLLATRWSPRAFDPFDDVTEAELAALLEAARWAPSNHNSQPWRFAVGQRGSEEHKRIFANLDERNQRWAGEAPVLLLGAHVVGPGMDHAAYDLGQAVAHLSVQAAAFGLYIHQMAGFAPDSLSADLDLPEDVVPKVVIAVGRLGDPGRLPEDLQVRETTLRCRRPLADLML